MVKEKISKEKIKAKRQSIRVLTLNKVRDFLEKQTKPIYKSEIMRKLGVDYTSVKIALTMLGIKEDKEGRIYIKSNKKIKGR